MFPPTFSVWYNVRSNTKFCILRLPNDVSPDWMPCQHLYNDPPRPTAHRAAIPVKIMVLCVALQVADHRCPSPALSTLSQQLRRAPPYACFDDKTTRIQHLLTKLYLCQTLNPLNAELNPICYLLALLGAHHFPHVSRIRVKSLTFRLLMSYIWSTHSWCF